MAEQNATNTASSAIGEVQSVTGRVVAIGANGVERQLFAGDLVYPDDLIKTGDRSTIVVALKDGTRFDLGRDSEALLDEAVYSDDIAALKAAALVDVAELQRAIAEGADPTEVAEAPAAGSEVSSGGESIEFVTGQDRTGRIGVVEAGYETTALARGFDPLLADPIDFGVDTGGLPPTPPIDTKAPTIDIDAVTGDNQVDDSEDGSVTLSGTSTGAVGQTVSVAIVDGSNNPVYSGTAVVQADGRWSIPNVDLSGLPDEAGYTVTADVSDAAGNAATQASEPFTTEDTTAPAVNITLDANITTDDLVSPTEATQNAIVTGTVGGDVADTDEVTLTVNGNSYTGPVSGGTFAIAVPGSDLAADADNVIEASITVTDAAGNSATAKDIEGYSVGSSVDPADMGLRGEYYGYNDRSNVPSNWLRHNDDGDFGNLNNLGEVSSIIDSRTGTGVVGSVAAGAADETFLSGRVDYGTVGGNLGTGSTLQQFLSGDAGSLSGDPANSTDGIVRIIGFMMIDSANLDFRIRSDDGFQVRIGDTTFGLPTNHAPRTDVFNDVNLDTGLQEVEIIYWDQGGQAVLEIEVKESGQPSSAYNFLDTGDFGLFTPSFVDGLAPNQTIIEDPDNAGQYLVVEGAQLTGESGADELSGGDYLDILVGGGGDDLLTGGAGADEFVWANGDQGTFGDPAVDRVTDFGLAEGDVLDIQNLLIGESVGDLTDYLHFEQDGQDAVVHISSDGGFSGGYVASAEDQTIVLQNVDFSGFATDQDIIDSLIASNALITD